MATTKLGDLFSIVYPSQLVFGHQQPDADGIPFVTSKGTNNGIAGYVKPISDAVLFPAGAITVPLKGTVLAAFLQPFDFYCAHQIAILMPKVEMTDEQKLFYVYAIRQNRYRYNYGRQADRTLREMNVPATSKIPKWVDSSMVDFTSAQRPELPEDVVLPATESWATFIYKDLFEIERGRGARRKDLVAGHGMTPFITSTNQSNGLTGFTTAEACHPAGSITVNRNGSVAEAFYQPEPFCSTEDVHVFKPRFELTPAIALFLTTLIRREKFRYGYGRKWGLERMKVSTIKLPATHNDDGDVVPNWSLIERFVKSLPYSSMLS